MPIQQEPKYDTSDQPGCNNRYLRGSVDQVLDGGEISEPRGHELNIGMTPALEKVVGNGIHKHQSH